MIEVGAVLSSGQANAECYQDGSAPSLTCLHEAPIVAATLTGGSGKRGLSGDNGAGQGATIIPVDIAHSLPAGDGGATEDGTGRGCPLVVAPTLRTGGNDHADEYNVVPVEVMTLAIRGRGGSNDLEYRTDGTANAILTPNGGRAGIGVGAIAFAADDYATGSFGEVTEAGPLTTSADRTRSAPIIATLAVRRLTPRECERLQGFPDDYTLITVRGKPAADGPRYKALGNSMAVPVMARIGKRIQMVDGLPSPDSPTKTEGT